MAIFIPQYSSVFVFLNNSQLGSIADSTAKKMANISNLAVQATDLRVFFRLALGATPNAGGAVELWLASSVDGAVYTDGYAVSHTIENTVSLPLYSKHVVSISALSTTVTWEGSLLDYIPSLPPYFGLVVVNRTGVVAASDSSNTLHGRYIGFEYA